MKLNQILISLEEYDALRDFKANIEKGNSYSRTSGGFGGYSTETILTSDEMINKIKQIETELKRKIEILEITNNTLCTKHWAILSEIKQMSIREFLKWRKQK